MAKFTISLCVLLIACGACQAQLSLFSTLTNGFAQTVKAGTAAKTSPTSALSSLISSSPLSSIANVATDVANTVTSSVASSPLSSIANVATDVANTVTSSVASSPLSSITDAATNAVSAATSGDASSLLSTVTNAVSDGVNLATTAAGSANGLGSLLSGITGSLLSVTNSGTSNPLLSLLTAPTTTWITAAANQMKTQMSTIMGVMKSTLRIAESLEIVAMDSISSSLGQLGNVLDSLTNTDMNVDSCIAIASGIQEIAGTAMINTTTCSRTMVETMESDFNRAITVSTVFLEYLSSLAKEIDACAKVGFFSMLGCVAEVSSTTGAKCVESFGSTLSEVSSIMAKIANVQTELTSCGMQSAQEQVQKRILSETVNVAKCVVEMGQSGLSGASVENVAKAMEIANQVLSTTISG